MGKLTASARAAATKLGTCDKRVNKVKGIRLGMQHGAWTPQADGCSGLHGRGPHCQRTGHPQLCFHCVCS